MEKSLQVQYFYILQITAQVLYFPLKVKKHLIIGHGLTVIARNYLEVYPYDKWSDKEIADYESIKQFQPTSIDLVHGETEPPQLLTEADLIALMDKHGIGKCKQRCFS